jgi:uncharacterized delta-60 repeat protein
MKTSSSPTATVTGARLAPRATTLLLALGIHILGFTASATAAPGDLDPTFGTGGISDSVIPGNAVALARQADGKIVVVGQSGGGVAPTGHVWAIARLTRDGVLDSSFSEDGWTTIDFGLNHERPTAVAIQPDGKIVVGGCQDGVWADFALARINTNGTLDTSFSGDGKVVTPLVATSQDPDYLTSLLIQPNGMIVAVGHTNTGGDMAAVRYTSTGSLDTSFGSNGIARVGWESSGFSINTCTASALQPDGKILLTGSVSGLTKFGVCRLLPTGVLDTSFSQDGWVVWDFATGQETPESIVLQQDGKIVVSGKAGTTVSNGYDNSNDDYAVMRLMPNGDFDTSFSGDGKNLIPIESAAGGSQAGNRGGPKCLIRPDGKILLAGWYPRGTPNSSVWCLTRLDAAGSLDTTFSGDGFSTALPNSSVDSIYAITPQPDGKILAVILAGTFRVARFIVDEDSDGDGVDDPTEIALGTGVLDPDSDDDGLSDGKEVAEYQCNPLDPDSDDDGLLDGAEVNTHHSSPTKADTDGDGLNDYVEVVTYGTNPSRADTDGDGLSDPEEIQTYHTNPLDADMDDDGLSDGFEIHTTGSSPIKKDTDDDGYLDKFEYESGFSPTNAASHPVAQMFAHLAVELEVVTQIGKNYRLQVSDDMTSWADTDTIIVGTGGSVRDHFERTTNGPKKFWRVREETP